MSSIIRITLALLLCLLTGSCQVGRYVVYNFADITDYKKFPSRPLTAPPDGFRFQSAAAEKAPKSITAKGKKQTFDDYLESSGTVAFLIVRNDSIYYEHYFDGYSHSSVVASFSMAKSVTSILIGCAIDDSLIRSVDEPVTRYIPELKDKGFESVTIRHLLQMTSGIRFNESYVNPFGHAAGFYYGRHLKKKMLRLKLHRTPGTGFEYISGATQVLGWVLERSLKGKTITAYLQEKLWTPLGMEYDGSWSIDQKKEGMEKTFCCLNARARDFARIGRLYLQQGSWEGRQIVSQDWVRASTKVDTSEGSAWFYQYQWWLPGRDGDFMANGFLGQYIYVHPAKNLIVVRLGKKEGNVDWFEFMRELAALY